MPARKAALFVSTKRSGTLCSISYIIVSALSPVALVPTATPKIATLKNFELPNGLHNSSASTTTHLNILSFPHRRKLNHLMTL